MTLLRLEILRVLRTRRWMLVVGVYAAFGLLGPLLARYMNELLERFGGDELMVVGQDPQPIDGIVQFLSNATQLGLLAVIVVAAGSLAIDARPEVAAFLRTRVCDARTLLLPRLVVAASTVVAALVVGTAVAWAMTAVLLGGLPVGSMLLGTALGALYLLVVVVVVAFMATVARSVVGAVFASLVVLVALPIVSLVPAISAWLPSELLTAVAGLIDGEGLAEYLPAVGTSLVTIVVLVEASARRAQRREL
ncbi:MAG: hypothetical protein ACSLFO_04850 [Acidimicrobiales bacterium]